MNRLSAALIALASLAASAKAAADPPGTEPPPPRPRLSSLPLRFDSEIIRMRIVGDSLEVDGTYFLACQQAHPRSLPLFYPFPADSLLQGARMIEGRTRIDDGPWEALRFEVVPRATGVRWWAPPCSGRMIEMQGLYRQGLKEKYARYIVTTTRAWQEPLRHARFEIRLPEGTIPIEFSFPFKAERDSLRPGIPIAGDSSRVVYVWETDSFFPDRDIIVRWR